MTRAVLGRQQGLTAPRDPALLLGDFSEWLGLNVAEGAPSDNTVRTYNTQAGQFVSWCQAQKVDPAQATEDQIRGYRKALIEHGYTRGTVALKLGVVRRLYAAAVWRGLRLDNPAAGLKAPADRTVRAERVKFLPLDGLRRLLTAPQGDGLQARRDRAMLALMGIHGLRVAEVAALEVGDLDLDAGRARVTGKGSKQRTAYLIPQSAAPLADWLAVRPDVARAETAALFVVVGHRDPGTGLSDRAIRSTVDGYLETVGLKAAGVSCHALRHSAATWARAGGAQLDALAGMLGHSSTDTTRIYAQIVDAMAENPARYLAALLGA